jgi:hypothetical protein
MSTLYHFHVYIANFSPRKMCFNPKSQKNVPANNCHLKVAVISTCLVHQITVHTCTVRTVGQVLIDDYASGKAPQIVLVDHVP